MGMLSYYVYLGYSMEEARKLANPSTSKPDNCRARRWFKPGVPVETVPDRMLQSGTRAQVTRRIVRFIPKGKNKC